MYLNCYIFKKTFQNSDTTKQLFVSYKVISSENILRQLQLIHPYIQSHPHPKVNSDYRGGNHSFGFEVIYRCSHLASLLESLEAVEAVSTSESSSRIQSARWLFMPIQLVHFLICSAIDRFSLLIYSDLLPASNIRRLLIAISFRYHILYSCKKRLSYPM